MAVVQYRWFAFKEYAYSAFALLVQSLRMYLSVPKFSYEEKYDA